MSVIKKKVDNINGYLLNGDNFCVKQEKVSIFGLPEMRFGGSACDGGALVLNNTQKENLIKEYPCAEVFIKRHIGSVEIIKNIDRWCLWVTDENLEDALKIPPMVKAFEESRASRLKAKSAATRALADKPHKFKCSTHYKAKRCLCMPQVSSSSRLYLPSNFYDKDTVPSSKAFMIYDCEDWVFSLFSSNMHILWLKVVGGRLKIDFNYSNTLVYNTFPVPELNDEEKGLLSQYARCILKEREDIGGTLVELYNPKGMPKSLLEIHKELDNYLDTLYMKESGVLSLTSDDDRLAMLLGMYQNKKSSLF